MSNDTSRDWEALKKLAEDAKRLGANGTMLSVDAVLELIAEVERLRADSVDKAEAWDAISEKNAELSQLKAERDRMAEALGRMTKFFIDAEQQAECLVKTEEETGIGDIKTAFEAVVFNDDGQDFQMWIEYARKVRSALNTGEKTDG